MQRVSPGVGLHPTAARDAPEACERDRWAAIDSCLPIHIDDYMNLDLRLPLYQRLRDTLAAAVAEGQWRPGDAIPSEADLAKRHGVAIGTVRKAVDQLLADGVLDRQQGRGTFVKRAGFNASR